MKSWLAAATTVLGGVLLSSATGCASTPTGTLNGAPAKHPEVVSLDFLNASGQANALCSGTLLAPSVVLTTATCAQGTYGAFVIAPDADNQKSSISRVYTYDWTANGDHSVQHDLALVVLSKDITIASYPKVWSHNADGIDATQVHRSFGDVAIKSTIATSSVSIRTGRPAGHALTLYVHGADLDVGGPLVGTDDNGNVAIVGVMVGLGTSTGGGYAARVADSNVRSWITTIVANPSYRPKAASTTPNLAKMETLDDDDDDGGGDFGAGEAAPQPTNDTPQQNNDADTTNPQPDTTTEQQPAAPAADANDSQPSNETTSDQPAQNANANANADATADKAPQATVDTNPPANGKFYDVNNAQDVSSLKAMGFSDDQLQPPSTAERIMSTIGSYLTPSPEKNMLQDTPVSVIGIRG